MSIKRPPGAAFLGQHLDFGRPGRKGNGEVQMSLPNVAVPDGMTTIEHQIVDTLPWFSPSVVSVIGRTDLPQSGGLLALVTYEWPFPYFFTANPISKENQELIHVERFRTDVATATGKLPFEALVRGKEPPDFFAQTSRGSIGVECTVLPDNKRRRVEGLFSNIRQRILSQPRENWSRLTGHVIVAWFADESSFAPTKLPHKVSDSDAIGALMESLSRFTPGIGGDGLGQPGNFTHALERMGVASSGLGCLFYAVPMHNAVPVTDFFARTGFELACLYESLHTAGGIATEIDRLVRQHDKPGVDWLLFTIAGPRRDGLIHPTESVLANTFLASSIPIARPSYIRKVFFHFFPSGGCFEVFPRNKWWFESQYEGGIEVAHHKRLAARECEIVMQRTR